MPADTRARADAKERMLDAAEELIARKGFHAATVRQIVRAAGTELGSFTYHFTSKAGMFDQIVRRRAAEVDRATADVLKAIMTDGNPTLEKLIGALVTPILARMDEQDSGWANYMKLVSSMISASREEDHDHIRSIYLSHESTGRFIEYVEILHPEATHNEILSLYIMINAASLHVFQGSILIDVISGGQHGGPAPDRQAIMAAMPVFFAAGFRALIADRIGKLPQQSPSVPA